MLVQDLFCNSLKSGKRVFKKQVYFGAIMFMSLLAPAQEILAQTSGSTTPIYGRRAARGWSGYDFWFPALKIGSVSKGVWVNAPEVVSGKITLDTVFKNGRNAFVNVPAGTSIQYTVDEKPVGPVLTDNFATTLDTALFSDGTHALGVRMVKGTDLDRFRRRPYAIIISNLAAPSVGPQRVPVTGFYFSSSSPTGRIDWINFTGIKQSRVEPYPVVVAPPAHTMTDTEILGLRSPSKWFIEPLTQRITSLYQAAPTYYTTPEGGVVVESFYAQSGHTAEIASYGVKKHQNYDGGRNNNSVSPYSTYVGDPNGSDWIGIDIAGRLFRLKKDGSVVTIAGHFNRRDVLPLHYKGNTYIYDSQFESVQNFRGNFDVPFNMPIDLVFDPRNSKILYVADTANHRIARVDLSQAIPVIRTYAGQVGIRGYNAGSVPTASALFNAPYSIAMAKNGTMYVADFNNQVIRTISPDGKTVGTLVGRGPVGAPSEPTVAALPAFYAPSSVVSFASAHINYPQVIRMDSAENIILGEPVSLTVRKIDIVNKRVSFIKDLSESSLGSNDHSWIWLDVDKKGNIGPVDDILITQSTGRNNTNLYRTSKDGSYSTFLQDKSGGSPLHDGQGCCLHDIGGHYPWAVAISDNEGRYLATGFGGAGVISARIFDETRDPKFAFDITTFNRGGAIWGSGSVAGFPAAVRPSFTALLGTGGYNRLGTHANVDDLVALYPNPATDDVKLADYITKGMGGSVPRPEITGDDMRALIYFIRRNSLKQGGNAILPPTMARSVDRTVPIISGVVVSKVNAGTLRITWKTNEPAIGVVQFGITQYSHDASAIEAGYSTSHSATVNVTGIPVGTLLRFVIISKDQAGNQGATIHNAPGEIQFKL